MLRIEENRVIFLSLLTAEGSLELWYTLAASLRRVK